MELAKFLELEHSGALEERSGRPARLAQCHYDVVQEEKHFQSHESIVDLESGKVVRTEIIHESHHAMLTKYGSPDNDLNSK